MSDLPRLELLRRMSHRRVLETVVADGPATRAELAARTGLSKPTVSQAVGRLEAAGLLVEAGAQTGRRGRVGTYYDLPADAGTVLAVGLDQAGVAVRAVDLAGREVGGTLVPPTPGHDPEALARDLRDAVAATAGRSLRAVGVSVANPVDPVTGEVRPLPDAPFPEGLLQPTEVLAGLGVPVLVDNDVNLAARAEQDRGAARGVSDVALVYLGAGLGGAVVVDGRLRRGSSGYAGEVGYLPVGGVTLLRDLASTAPALPGVPALDVPEVRRLLDAGDSALADVLGEAGATAAVALCAATDPALVLLVGPVGTHPAVLPAVRRSLTERWPFRPEVRAGTVGPGASLLGAEAWALEVALDAALAAVG